MFGLKTGNKWLVIWLCGTVSGVLLGGHFNIKLIISRLSQTVNYL